MASDSDMPQPVSSVPGLRRHFTCQYSPAIIREKPELCGLLSSVVCLSAMLEVQLWWALAMLLGTDSRAGVAMYAVLHNTAQRQAVEAAAATALSPDDLQLFNAILRLVRGVQKRRNEIVHGTWGVSPEVPDALILIRGEDALAEAMQVFAPAHLNPAPDGGVVCGADAMTVPYDENNDYVPLDKTFIYKERDFTLLLDDMSRAMASLGRFWYPASRGDSTTAEQRHLLSLEPHIQTALRPHR
jgi:hypothetical protein